MLLTINEIAAVAAFAGIDDHRYRGLFQNAGHSSRQADVGVGWMSLVARGLAAIADGGVTIDAEVGELALDAINPEVILDMMVLGEGQRRRGRLCRRGERLTSVHELVADVFELEQSREPALARLNDAAELADLIVSGEPGQTAVLYSVLRRNRVTGAMLGCSWITDREHVLVEAQSNDGESSRPLEAARLESTLQLLASL